jgi:hypothetical protein
MLDATGFAELCVRRPFLFHVVHDTQEAKLDSILSCGLERTRSHYEGFWESRPRHVYMGSKDYVGSGYLSGLREDGPYSVLRVDVAKLDRERINPDEDHFQTQNFLDEKQRNFVGGKHVCAVFGIEFPPTHWLWEWGEWLHKSVGSLGDWAEAVNLGSDPRHVRHSMRRGSLAYDGIVPPAALSVVSSGIGEAL